MSEVKSISMKDMCETIVESHLLMRPDGTPPTAEEIFNYSPTGELYMVFEWYEMALILIKINKTE
jgi:hypothetical protein